VVCVGGFARLYTVYHGSVGGILAIVEIVWKDIISIAIAIHGESSDGCLTE